MGRWRTVLTRMCCVACGTVSPVCRYTTAFMRALLRRGVPGFSEVRPPPSTCLALAHVCQANPHLTTTSVWGYCFPLLMVVQWGIDLLVDQLAEDSLSSSSPSTTGIERRNAALAALVEAADHTVYLRVR